MKKILYIFSVFLVAAIFAAALLTPTTSSASGDDDVRFDDGNLCPQPGDNCIVVVAPPCGDGPCED